MKSSASKYHVSNIFFNQTPAKLFIIVDTTIALTSKFAYVIGFEPTYYFISG